MYIYTKNVQEKKILFLFYLPFFSSLNFLHKMFKISKILKLKSRVLLAAQTPSLIYSLGPAYHQN